MHDLFTKCALIHLYIQKIQPYEDGNTRLASMLMNRLLFQSNLSIHVIAQVNNALNTEKEVYFSWHDKMRQNGNDVTEYLIWFFNLLKNSLVHLESKKGSHKSNQRIKSEDHDLNLNQLQVLNLLHSGSLPYINLNDWSKLTDSKISVAKKHCEELISRQILSKKGEGNHAKYYVQNQSSDKFSVAAA